MLVRTRLTVTGTYRRRGDRLEVSVDGIPVVVWRGAHPNSPGTEAIVAEAQTEEEAPEEVAEYLFARAAVRPGQPAPEEVMNFGGMISAKHSAACRRCIEVLRWRTRADTPHHPYAGLGTEWSVNGSEWHRLPTRGSIAGRVLSGLILTPEGAGLVQPLVNENAEEPIAHKLLREARDGSTSNPRSAVVISVAAPETGFKQLVAVLVPDATWLIETVASPPLVKMLREYLPLLPLKATIDGRVYAPPKYVRTLLTNAVEERNLVSHRGTGALGHQELADTLDAIEDTLYLFDFYSGHDWALDEIRDEFRAGFGT